MKRVKIFAELMDQVKDDPEMYEHMKKARSKALFEYVTKAMGDDVKDAKTAKNNRK